MSFIRMRTIPGLFVGRRTVILAETDTADTGAAYSCGACGDVLVKRDESSALADVVVKCGCGEINQL